MSNKKGGDYVYNLKSSSTEAYSYNKASLLLDFPLGGICIIR